MSGTGAGPGYVYRDALGTLGARMQMLMLAARLKEGRRYAFRDAESGIIRSRLLVKKYPHFAVFEFPGISGSYTECRGWFDLCVELRKSERREGGDNT